MRFAHTLLFACPDCNLPVAVSRISDEKNLEEIDSQLVKLKCECCEKLVHVPAITAKEHWVSDWPLVTAPVPSPLR